MNLTAAVSELIHKHIRATINGANCRVADKLLKGEINTNDAQHELEAISQEINGFVVALKQANELKIINADTMVKQGNPPELVWLA